MRDALGYYAVLDVEPSTDIDIIKTNYRDLAKYWHPIKLNPLLCCIAYLQKQIYPTSSFATDLKAVLSSFPNVDTTAMGFPAGWRDEALWK